METLEVILGIVVYFLLMSLVATAIAEMISSWRSTRGRFLREAVKVACGGGESFCLAVYRHPLIDVLYPAKEPAPIGSRKGMDWLTNLVWPSLAERRSLPSYIPPASFARAFIETSLGMPLEQVGDLGTLFAAEKPRWVKPDPAGTATANELGAIESKTITPQSLTAAYAALRPHVLAAKADAAKTLELLGEQFTHVNDRATGWFKRRISRNLFVIGLLLAVATNGDATRVVSRLNSDPGLRTEMLALADTMLATNRPARVAITGAATGTDQVAPTREELLTRVRIVESVTGGWSKDPALDSGLGWRLLPLWLFKILGFLFTASAVSLGAPFWFDLLGKLVNVRNTIKRGAPTPEAAGGQPAPTRTEAEIAARLVARGADVGAGPFTPSADALAIGREMTMFSELAYQGELEFKARLAALGYAAAIVEPISGQESTGVGVRVDTQAYAVRTAKRVVVAFRGTEPTIPADIVTDLRFKLVPVDWAGAPGSAHQGFLAALKVVWGDVLAALRKLNTANPLPVYFCGHSLGGALAVLAAVRYLGDKEAFAQDPDLRQRRANGFGGVHTIGQPRVGEAAFAKWAAGLLRGNYTRAINNRDVVPRVPPSRDAGSYQHFGTVHFFDSQGTLWVNPTWFFRLLDYALPDQELQALAKEPVADHAAAEYVRLYTRISGPPAALA